MGSPRQLMHTDSTSSGTYLRELLQNAMLRSRA